MQSTLPLDQYFPVLRDCALVAGIESDKIARILPCLSAAFRQAEKNTFILSAEDKADTVGLILSRKRYVISEDYWGRKDILSRSSARRAFLPNRFPAPRRSTSRSVVVARRQYRLSEPSTAVKSSPPAQTPAFSIRS